VAGYQAPLWLDRLAGVAWRFLAVLVAVIALIGLIVGFGSVILPLFLGLLFASALDPIYRTLRHRGVRPALASLAAIAVLAVLAGLVAWTTIRAVADQWASITADLDDGVERLVDSAEDAGVDAATAEDVADDVTVGVKTVIDWIVVGVTHVLPVAASIATTVVLGLLVAFFFMKDGAYMWRWTVQLTSGSGELVDRIGRRIWTTISGYILGQAAIAAIDATLISLGALILGVPHVGAILLLTFLGAFVPYIGALLAGAFAVLLAVSDGGLTRGVAMLAIVLAVQFVEGNVLQPWIQGRAVRLHPLVVALSVVAGGALAGFLGIFLAVPVTASAFVALDELRKAGLLGYDMPAKKLDVAEDGLGP
jgi:predicted PurR-regulated permease PerM